MTITIIVLSQNLGKLRNGFFQKGPKENGEDGVTPFATFFRSPRPFAEKDVPHGGGGDWLALKTVCV
jgi:hypothetical protein